MDILDTQKLRIELAKINKSYSWLAKEIGYTRQYMNYLVKTESTRHIKKMAEAMDMEVHDLIK